ncbi:MAG: efflux RND transporter periplasmic adaptor subunit [Desulforhopalus sp.]
MFISAAQWKSRLTTCIILVIAVVLLPACNGEEPQFDDQPKPVQWLKVEPVDHSAKRILSGVLQPIENADLSFEVGGKIENIFVEPGDLVQENEILATLDETTFQLNVQQKKSQRQEALAQLVSAKSNFERKKNLLDSGAVSELEYERSKSTYKSTLNQVQSLEAQLDIAQKNLDDTDLLAPYAGRISDRYMEPSQQVQAGVPVVRIISLEGLEVSVSIPETFVQNLATGEMHRVHFPAYPEMVIPAELTELSFQADGAGGFPAILQLEETPEKLKAGMTAEVTLILKKMALSEENNNPFKIPLTAIVQEDGLSFSVFLFNEQKHIASKTPVQISKFSQNTAQVTSGLKEGDILISHGASFLHDGQAVTLIGVGPDLYQE